MFSRFVLAESLKSKQILALHKFNELYKDQVMLDLRESLGNAWKAVLKTAKANLSKDEALEALASNEKALVKAELSLIPVKSHYGSKLVSPSVSIPLLLPEERRNLLEKSLLNAAETELIELIRVWSDAFMFERSNGELKTDFKVKRDAQSVRLIIGNSASPHEVVICYVTVEHGKPNTKLKAYDLVCLCMPAVRPK
jgi:hypothetical protein